MTPLARSLAVLLALALTLTGCSGDDDADGPEPTPSVTASPTPPAPPPIAAAWTASGERGEPQVATDDLLVFARLDGTVVTLDRATGDQVSSWSVGDAGGRLCSTSEQLGRDHLLGLLLREKGRRCTVAAALDVRTGELRWRTVLPSTDPDRGQDGHDDYHEGLGVAVGDRVLLATTTCDEVRRLSLADGRELGSIAPRDRACRNDSVTDGQQVAILDFDPEEKDYADQAGQDFFRAVDGPGAFALYDADSGKRLWAHPVPDHTTASMSQLVDGDPAVLTTSVRGRGVTRIWGADGTPGPYLGKSSPRVYGEGDSVDVVGRSDDTIVVSYPGGAGPAVLYAYDLVSGQERWRLVSPGADVGSAATTASVVGDRLVLAVQQVDGTDLLGYDLADPGTPEVLGRAPGRDVLVGDLLLDTSGGGLTTAYRVPERGQGEVRAYETAAADDGWADDDVRPSEAIDACDAVGPEVLDEAGLAWGDLPVPVDCTWRNDDRPDYVRHGLEVVVQVGRPAVTGDETTTAVEAAQEIAASARQPYDDEPALPPLPAGDGDEAWGRFGTPDRDTRSVADLVTRWRNVVVTVHVDQSLDLEDRAAALVPYDRLQDAAYDATADVLEGLGAEPVAATRGVDSATTAVGDVCAAVAPVVGDLFAAGRPTRGATGQQQRTCVWREPGRDDEIGDLVVVVADVVPGAPDGTSAADRAAQVAMLLGGGRRAAQAVDGLPGVSTVRRYTSADGDFRVWDTTSRVDDLVVWAHHEVGTTTTTAAAMDAAGRRLVTAAVGARN